MPELESPRASTIFEIEVLVEHIRKLGPLNTYMEIGSRSGGSLASFGKLFPHDSLLLALDLAKETDAGKTNRITLLEVIDQLTTGGQKPVLIDMDSTTPEAIEAVRSVLCETQVDVLLIDGGHEGHTVYQDVENYVQFVRPGGLIIMHDVGPTQYLGTRSKSRIRAGTLRNFYNCYAAWFNLAMSHKRKMIVQEDAGYGLVWKDD